MKICYVAENVVDSGRVLLQCCHAVIPQTPPTANDLVEGFCVQQRHEMNKGWKLRLFGLTKAVVLPDILGQSTAH